MVEQRTENPRVSSSTLLLGTFKRLSKCGSSSAVEYLPAEKEVASLNLSSALFEGGFLEMSRSGGMVDAAVSKTVGR